MATLAVALLYVVPNATADDAVTPVPESTAQVATAPDTQVTTPTDQVPAQVPAAPAPQPAAPAPAPVPAKPTPKFAAKLATFNILGSQHRRGGMKRAGMTARIIQNSNVDVIGMQEVQYDQLAVLSKRLKGYNIWPNSSFNSRQGLRLQIAYRADKYDVVSTGSIMTRFDRQVRPIPYTRLKDRASGQEFYFVTVHNSPKSMEGERDHATAVQIGLVKRLQRQKIPVFISGDTNEFVEFSCKMGRQAGMVSASGDRVYPRCAASPSRPVIDKILGVKGLRFSDYSQTRDGLVSAASDHYFVSARVAMP